MKDVYVISVMSCDRKRYFAVEDGDALLVERIETAWRFTSALAARDTLWLCLKAYPHMKWRVERLGKR